MVVWVEQTESFFCTLDDCTFELGECLTFGGSVDVDSTHDANRTAYACKNVQCQCIPGRILCGEDGSIGSPSKTTYKL
jgi:hypothetical protein